jgi:hypothetical protein
VPETGFNTAFPVGDTHWSSGIGLGDVRKSKNPRGSASGPEMAELSPWWRDRIAGEVGLESVPAQGALWGLLSKATKIKSKIGAPKLEMLATELSRRSKVQGISLEEAWENFAHNRLK